MQRSTSDGSDAPSDGSDRGPEAELGAPGLSAPDASVEVVDVPALEASHGRQLLAMSPSGQQVATVHRSDDDVTPHELCVFDVGSSDLRACVELEPEVGWPHPSEVSWSSDGQRLAFSNGAQLGSSRVLEGNVDVFVFDLEAAQLVNLTASGLSGQGRSEAGHRNYIYPSFSPDGSQIAAVRDGADRGAELVVIDPQQDTATAVADLDTFLRPVWQDDTTVWSNPMFMSDRPPSRQVDLVTGDVRSVELGEIVVEVAGGPLHGQTEIVGFSDDGSVGLLWSRPLAQSYYATPNLPMAALLDPTSGQAFPIGPDVGSGSSDPDGAAFLMGRTPLTADGTHVVYTYHYTDDPPAEGLPDRSTMTARIAVARVDDTLAGAHEETVLVDDLFASVDLDDPKLLVPAGGEQGGLWYVGMQLASVEGSVMLPVSTGDGSVVFVRVQVGGL